MRLSVVIPVYNERPTIEECLKRVQAVAIDKEVLIIDDASTDGTREALAALPPDPNVRIFFQPENRGKGAAVRRGFTEAAGDVVVIQDADLEYDPQDYHKLLEPILSGRADVVYGSRFLGWPRRVLRFRHQLANLSHVALQSGHRLEPHRHGDLLQDDPPRGREQLATAFGPLRH